MSIALQAAQKSKDPSTQVGACIVDQQNKILSLGYNGFPKGINDALLPMERTGEFLETKYPYVVHAEENAIINATRDLKGAKLYATLYPCNECAKSIIQSGISEVIYLDNKYKGMDIFVASEKMLNLANVERRQFIPSLEKMTKTYNLIQNVVKNVEID